MRDRRGLGFWVRSALVGATMACAVGQTGCLSQIILNGQISSTRKASAALNTVGDYEIAEKAAFAGIAQLEGLRYLAPDNTDALFLLTRSWASVGLGFIEDKMEEAEDAEGTTSPAYDYHKRRAIAAYDRAIYYGIQLLESDHEGFRAATRNNATMKEYLAQFDEPEQAENLFWVGYAWLGKTNAAKEDPAVVGELHVAAALLERSIELDETYLYGSAHVALGAYHARSPMAEVEEAKQHFDQAIKLSEGKTLLPKVQLALRYYCLKGDKAAYEATLKEVLAAKDGDPYQRLPNTIAKRKAKRFLAPARMNAQCGF